MLPFESCMAEVEAWVDNLDFIPPIKAKLFDLSVNGPPEKWCEFGDEWPNLVKMHWELWRDLVLKYDDAELVDMVFEALAEKYVGELEGMMKHD